MQYNENDVYEYTKLHRTILANNLPKEALVIISSATKAIRNHDVHYPFRQKSSFYWLTAFDEPNAIWVLEKNNHEVCTHLYHQGYEEKLVLWESPPLSHTEITNSRAIDKVDSIEQAEAVIKNLCSKYQDIWLLSDDCMIEKVKIWADSDIHALDNLMQRCRLQKTPIELSCIEKACEISMHAHKMTIAATKKLPYTNEYQIQAQFAYQAQMQGAATLAYPTIAASGNNACILHYTKNNASINNNDLVLLDAGCEVNNYAADITRTWPLSGTFTVEQKAIYQAVLTAQEICINALRPGIILKDINDMAIRSLTQSLINIGLISVDIEEAIEKKAYYPYFCHGIGHSLGLDVHDTQPKAKDWVLKENMVLTIEPGLYIPKNQGKNLFEGIGVRIEDNIRITNDGYQNLTAKLPKQVEQIEEMLSIG